MSLRFGVLGTGYWAGETHAAGIVAHAGAELVGVWGRNPAKAEALGRRFGVGGYEDLDALLEAVDAVAIAVPPDVQADLAVRAARAGRHLLLDKPLALSLEQARSVVEAAEAGGVASSLAIPALDPVERVTAARGLGDTVHLLVGHHGGAASTLSLSLTVPEAAETTRFAVHGTAGWSAMPSDSTTVVEAFGEAISQLAGMIAAGTTEHPCDVRFGAEVVAILDAAERVLAAPRDAGAAPIQWRR